MIFSDIFLALTCLFHVRLTSSFQATPVIPVQRSYKTPTCVITLARVRVDRSTSVLSEHSGRSSAGNGDGAGDGASGDESEFVDPAMQFEMDFVPHDGADAEDPVAQVPDGLKVGKVYRDVKIDVGNIVQGTRIG